MKPNYRTQYGFTLVEIMIVVAIIGLLVSIAVPAFVRARTTSQKNTCIQNLRQVESATQVWALENRMAPDANVTFDDIRSYMKRVVTCPAGGAGASFASSYELHGITNRPTCRMVLDHVLPVPNEP